MKIKQPQFIAKVRQNLKTQLLVEVFYSLAYLSEKIDTTVDFLSVCFWMVKAFYEKSFFLI